MSSSKLAVGGIVLDQCNKCELMLAHTIVAKVDGEIKRVQCNTCKSLHNYRGGEKSAAKKKEIVSRRTAMIAPQLTTAAKFMKEMEGRSTTEAKPYDQHQSYRAGDLLQHQVFGLGIVIQLAGATKVEVLFREGLKILVANK